MGRSYRLGELAELLCAQLHGDPQAVIHSLGTLQNAGPGQLAFLANPKYRDQLSATGAEAVILHSAQAGDYSGNSLVVDNPYHSYAKASALFDQRPQIVAGVHPRAFVDPSASLGEGVGIGPGAIVEAGAIIGDNCQIGANTVIGAGCELGAGCQLAANVTLYHAVQLGERVVVHSGVVIGADGFGFAPKSGGGWQKIHQLGRVVVGDDCEIGACTTIDRGAIGDTVLGNNVILDNHVQIAHNVSVGDNTAMAAYSGVAGSSSIGKNCILAGAVGVVGHITICDNVQVTAKSLVTKNISKPGSYSAGTPLLESAQWRKSAVRFAQLDDMAKRLNKLEKQ